MKKTKDTIFVATYIDPRAHAALTQAAKREDRTLTKYLQRHLNRLAEREKQKATNGK